MPWPLPRRNFSNSERVPVRIGFTDSVARGKAKAARGRWDPEKKVWLIRYGNIKGTGLEKHIVLDAFPAGKQIQKHIILYATKASNIVCLYLILYTGI